MVEWANRELSTLEGQLAFWRGGVARVFNGPASDDGITDDIIATLEKHVADWRALMSQHNIPVKRLVEADA
jgi:hypothetical protein